MYNGWSLTQIKAGALSCGSSHCIHPHHALSVKKKKPVSFMNVPNEAVKVITLVKAPPLDENVFHHLYDTWQGRGEHLLYSKI